MITGKDIDEILYSEESDIQNKRCPNCYADFTELEVLSVEEITRYTTTVFRCGLCLYRWSDTTTSPNYRESESDEIHPRIKGMLVKLRKVMMEAVEKYEKEDFEDPVAEAVDDFEKIFLIDFAEFVKCDEIDKDSELDE